MSVGGSKGSGTTQTQLDPQLKQAWMNLNQQAQNVSQGMMGGPPNQQVAGLSADQQHADTYLNNNLTTGVQQLNQAEKLALDAGNYHPDQIDPMQVNAAKANNFRADAARVDPANGYNVATLGRAKTYDPAIIDKNKVGQVDAGALTDVNLKEYMNPYTQDVVNNTTQDWLRGLKQQQQSDKADAIAAGAFGGSREGVQRALTEEAADKTLASTVAGLNQSGYAQAQQAAQSDLDRNATVGAQNQNTALQVQQANQASRNTAGQFGATAQNANQQIDAAAKNAEHQFQAAGQNTVDLTNAANKQQVSLANAQSATGTSQFNAGQANNIKQGNQQASLAADTSNQNAGLTANAQQLSASGQLGSLAGEEQQHVMNNVGALNTQGAIDQAQAQKVLDTGYANKLADYQAPLAALQAAALPFGIIPTTNNGGTSTTNSTAKSAGLGGG